MLSVSNYSEIILSIFSAGLSYTHTTTTLNVYVVVLIGVIPFVGIILVPVNISESCNAPT